MKITTHNPFTGKDTGQFELDSYSQAYEKLLTLKNAQSAWQHLPVSQRLTLVKTALQYFEKNAETIAQDICEQMGRPVHQARGEIKGFFERANYMCEIAESVLSADSIPVKAGFERSVEHVPYGTIFVISAWNYPLLITVNSVIPGLIAGNTILLKHSSLTPKIGRHFENAFKNLGEHKNLLIQTIIDHKVTGELIEKGPVDHVIFTGSVGGGQSILQHTSKKFMAPALELGGKDAAYIHFDADLDQAADTIVDGAMYNSGQSCCGIERVYVHEKIYDEFLNKCKNLIEKYKLGDPKDPATNLGPLAQEKSAKVMIDQVEEAKSKGAQILLGGKVKKINSGTFFEPTLLTNVNHTMSIMKEENFGPILPVMKVSGLDQAIELTNDSDYGLTSAIFTNDMKVAKKFAEYANTGTVFLNRCDYLDPALPWTGVKNSGVGSALSKYGFMNVTRRKSIHFKILGKG
jgi:acyl-CoA reductase-like NAD-dependent aldehyde dehydrogenase